MPFQSQYFDKVKRRAGFLTDALNSISMILLDKEMIAVFLDASKD